MADVVALGVGQAVGVRPARYVFVAFACAICLASIASGAGASRWRLPQTLSGQSAGPPLFTAGANVSVAAWIVRYQSIYVSELIGRSGRFGPAERIRAGSDAVIPPSVRLADLAVSPRGDAVLVWTFADIPSDPPQYSVRSGLTGQWSVPASLDRHGEGMSGLTAGVDSTGTVTFAWIGSGVEGSSSGGPRAIALRTEVRLPDGSLLPVQTISQDAPDYHSSPPPLPPGYGYSSPQLSVAGSGAAVVAWDRTLSGGRRQVLFAQRAPGATSFGPRRALPWLAQAESAGDRTLLLRLQAGVGDRGGILLAWLSRASGRAVLLAQRVGSSGRLGSLQRLSPPGAADPRLAMNGRGDSVLAWRFYPRHPARVRAAVALAGRDFGRPATLPGAVGLVLTPQVAINPAGDALVAWRDFTTLRRGNERYANDSRLWSSLRVRGGRFTPPSRLPSSTFAVFGGVALASNGDAAAVWTEVRDLSSPVLGAVLR